MKKYLVSLLLTVLVSISFISCELPSTNEYPSEAVIGFEYKFTSNDITLAYGNSYFCEIYTINDSPVYEQTLFESENVIDNRQVEAIDEGDTLIIYAYKRGFTASRDKSTEDYLNEFRDNHERSFRDSVLIIGPSPIYQYRLEVWGDTLSLIEIDNICP